MTDANAATAAHGLQGAALSPEQLKAITDAVLPTLRSDINAALTSRLGGRDAVEELRKTVESLADQVKGQGSAGQGAKPNGAAGTGTNQGQEELRQQVATLQQALQQRDGELLRERKTTAIRSALVQAGVRQEALEDAIKLLSDRSDLKPSQDAHGNAVWEGQIKGNLGTPVQAGLGEVVKEFLSTRGHILPARGAGGSGATGGVGVAGGVQKPISAMTPDELAQQPPEVLNQLWEQGGGRAPGAGFFG